MTGSSAVQSALAAVWHALLHPDAPHFARARDQLLGSRILAVAVGLAANQALRLLADLCWPTGQAGAEERQRKQEEERLASMDWAELSDGDRAAILAREEGELARIVLRRYGYSWSRGVILAIIRFSFGHAFPVVLTLYWAVRDPSSDGNSLLLKLYLVLYYCLYGYFSAKLFFGGRRWPLLFVTAFSLPWSAQTRVADLATPPDPQREMKVHSLYTIRTKRVCELVWDCAVCNAMVNFVLGTVSLITCAPEQLLALASLSADDAETADNVNMAWFSIWLANVFVGPLAAICCAWSPSTWSLLALVLCLPSSWVFFFGQVLHMNLFPRKAPGASPAEGYSRLPAA